MAELSVNLSVSCGSEVVKKSFFNYLGKVMKEYHDYGSISEYKELIMINESSVLADEQLLVNIAEAFSDNLPDEEFSISGTITQHSPSYATMEFDIRYKDGNLSTNFESWNEDFEMGDDECECEYCGNITDKDFAYVVKSSIGKTLYFCDQDCFKSFIEDNELDENSFEIVSEGL